MYARLMGKTPFTIYQGKWSIMDRDLERDIILMCVSQGTPSLPVRTSSLSSQDM